jgi:molecular chaperone Hsp33
VRENVDPDKVGEATVRRYLDHQRDILVLVGNFGPMFAAYLDHVRRWESEPDNLSQTFMRQGLGAASLHLSCRPPGETIGWTINIHQPPTNVFITGDSRERTVTGRIFTENVRPADKSRMYVQTGRDGSTPVQSMVQVYGLDVLEIFEQYYAQSEQTAARFFEVTDVEFTLLFGLPDVDADWLRAISREEALGIAEDDLKDLGEMTFRFQCGCNPEKMLAVVRAMFDSDPDELFKGDSGVEVYCPRCARRWWVERKAFDDANGHSSSAP